MHRLSRKKSKRMTLRKKHKVVKEVADAKKRMRKEARRMARQGIKRVDKKDPGIPNLCPQKKELLQELQMIKKIETEHKNEVRLRLKEKQKDEEFAFLTEKTQPVYKDNSLEALISQADCIIEILDARDPYICPFITNFVEEKTRIFVVNKSDLVPEENLAQWKKVISKNGPCFEFQCPPKDGMKDEIMRFLADKESQAIAVTGYPNTGKSSFINAMKGYKAANVGKLPGSTKKIEEIKVVFNDDKGNVREIKFFDSPGIEIAEKGPVNALRATCYIEALQDPYTPVQGLLEKVSKEKLLIHYAIPEYKDIKEFLTHIAKKMGKVAKGGLPDFDAGAKIALHDFFLMKFPFYTPLTP
ncbi:hypothetical protein SteCoe_16032 [Stentor coeruleus]|uniref:CP-type G domain-containing protein n=1 Tax=Stentor coeruleus TaxID=5963 RepID=A0A1R2C2A7_9CILI|nr:hypothetical protein SteCoe_16032 [Stentor coeruleus]